MSGSWHADSETLALYAAQGLDDVRASSLEAHLLSCERCRNALAPSVAPLQLEAMWLGIETELDAPRPGIVEQTLRRLGVHEHVARLLSATPSLRLSWLAAEAFALGSAAFAAQQASGTSKAGGSLFVFLVIAALAPVAGVAAAFGPGVDPTYEIGLAAPMRGDRLLFIRATAVLCTSLLIGLLAAAALPGWDRTLILWLLPALGLTLSTLAVATWLRPAVAACVVGFCWLVVAAAASMAAEDALAAFGVGGQFAAAVATTVAVAVLVHRRSAYEGRIPA
jgi:hypothetical protein